MVFKKRFSLLITILAGSLVLIPSSHAQVNPEAERHAHAVRTLFKRCITDFTDTRSFHLFVNVMIAELIQHKQLFEEYFREHYPHLSVNGFIAALQKAKSESSVTGVSSALADYTALLPQDISWLTIINGLRKRLAIK